MTSNLHITLSEFARLLLERVQDSGLKFRTPVEAEKLKLPALPSEISTHLLSVDGKAKHICEEQPIIHIPAVLVLDVVVPWAPIPSRPPHLYYQAEESFEPYWLLDVKVVHFWKRDILDPPSSVLTPVEITCAFVQNPRLGSLQGRGGSQFNSRQVQVYRSDTNQIVLDNPSSGETHHLAVTTSGRLGLAAPRVKRVDPASPPPPAPGAVPAKPSGSPPTVAPASATPPASQPSQPVTLIRTTPRRSHRKRKSPRRRTKK